MTKPVQPYVLGPLKGNGHSDGYSLNIHEEGVGGGLGTRICQIPAFTWRSQKAVLDLGRQLAANPVLIAALEGAIGALEFNRDFIRDDEGHNPEDLAFAQGKLDDANRALAIARGEV